MVLNNLGVFAYFRGQWDEAIAFYQRGYDARLATGNDIEAAFGTCNIGEILANQGHYEEAERRFRDSLRIFRAGGYRYGIGYALLLSGQLACRSGAFEEAYGLLGEARTEFDASGLTTDIRLVDSRTAECLVFEGRNEEGLALADRLLSIGAAGLGSELPLLQRVRGYALLGDGEFEMAADALAVSLKSAEDLDATYEVALTLVAQRSLAVLMAQPEKAADLEWRYRVILDRLGVITVVEPSTVAASATG